MFERMCWNNGDYIERMREREGERKERKNLWFKRNLLYFDSCFIILFVLEHFLKKPNLSISPHRLLKASNVLF